MRTKVHPVLLVAILLIGVIAGMALHAKLDAPKTEFKTRM